MLTALLWLNQLTRDDGDPFDHLSLSSTETLWEPCNMFAIPDLTLLSM